MYHHYYYFIIIIKFIIVLMLLLLFIIIIILGLVDTAVKTAEDRVHAAQTGQGMLQT